MTETNPNDIPDQPDPGNPDAPEQPAGDDDDTQEDDGDDGPSPRVMAPGRTFRGRGAEKRG